MGVYYLWFTKTFILFQFLHNSFIIMKAFIAAAALAAMGYAAPAADPQLLQSGLPAGPLTPAWGDGVLTPRGVRPLHLEGFSEDVNQDGFVDPIGAAVAPVAVAAPAVHAVAAPAVTYAGYALPAVKPVEVKVEKVEPVEIKAPVVTYAAPSSCSPSPLCCSSSCCSPRRCPPTSSYPYLHCTSFSTHRNCPCGTHTYTNTLPHVLGAGAPILGGLG